MSGKTLLELNCLLVEPSHVQAKFIVRELNQAGVRNIDVVSDGESALKSLTAFKPDLVISAMHFPDMTGAQLVKRIRQSEEFSDVAFMLISSETGYEYIEPVRQAGVSAILPKPFESSQLKRALLNTLDMLTPNSLGLEELNPEDLKVLVVDDSSTARKHIRRVLGSMGIEDIIEADDGETAVPLLAEHFFDFIVTDYNMPHMDGKALLHHIRNNSTQSSVPVLMVTSEHHMANLTAVEHEGVSGICDKPFETDVVRNMIRKMMVSV